MTTAKIIYFLGLITVAKGVEILYGLGNACLTIGALLLLTGVVLAAVKAYSKSEEKYWKRWGL